MKRGNKVNCISRAQVRVTAFQMMTRARGQGRRSTSSDGGEVVDRVVLDTFGVVDK